MIGHLNSLEKTYGTEISLLLIINRAEAISNRAGRRRVEVSAPVLFFTRNRRRRVEVWALPLFFASHLICKFSWHAFWAWPGKCHLNQTNMALQTNMATKIFALNGWKIEKKFEYSCRKVFRKGLKRARSLLSGIRRLQGNTIFR